MVISYVPACSPERRIGVPHLGEVVAQPGFQVVATQNPVEYVATGHLSEALRDRFEHLGPGSYSMSAQLEGAHGESYPFVIEAGPAVVRGSRRASR